MHPKLVERKVQRREQRVKAATQSLKDRTRRHDGAILRQLALIQDLVGLKKQMPIPRQC
jgi:hypothetical protein